MTCDRCGLPMVEIWLKTVMEPYKGVPRKAWRCGKGHVVVDKNK